MSKYTVPILLYDDECDLCKRFKLALDRIPGTESITKVSIHEKDVFEAFPDLDPKHCQQVVHLIDEEGQILQGEKVLNYLVSQFPGVKKFTWLLESGMGEKAIGFFYEMSEKYRKSLLNRCSGCKKKGLSNNP